MDLNKLYSALTNLDKASKLLKEAGGLDNAAEEIDNLYDMLNNILCEARETANDIKSELHTDDEVDEDD